MRLAAARARTAALSISPSARRRRRPVPLSRSSFLTKQSAWLKDWRRRYFILKGSKLFFAKVRAAPPRRARQERFGFTETALRSAPHTHRPRTRHPTG